MLAESPSAPFDQVLDKPIVTVCVQSQACYKAHGYSYFPHGWDLHYINLTPSEKLSLSTLIIAACSVAPPLRKHCTPHHCPPVLHTLSACLPHV